MKQLNLLLVTAYLGLSAWTLKTVSDLKVEVAQLSVRLTDLAARVDNSNHNLAKQ